MSYHHHLRGFVTSVVTLDRMNLKKFYYQIGIYESFIYC